MYWLSCCQTVEAEDATAAGVLLLPLLDFEGQEVQNDSQQRTNGKRKKQGLLMTQLQGALVQRALASL